MTNEWPRIYTTTLPQRLNMTPAEIEKLWQEYREFWRGYTVPDVLIDKETLDLEYQKDWLEDKDSTYR